MRMPFVILLFAGLFACTATQAAQRAITLATGEGRVVTLSAPAANIFVADPKVAEARPASARTLFLFGVGAGRTTVAALDAAGRPIAELRVTVHRSNDMAEAAQAAVARTVPRGSVRIVQTAHSLLLVGTVPSAVDAARAVAVVRGFAPTGEAVQNELSVRDDTQVTLEVRIAEMSRDVTRALGINWQALGTIGRIGMLPALNFAVNGGTNVACSAGALLSIACPGVNLNGLVDALSTDGLLHVLAEPNLTVASGRKASFLAGGEFPIPVAQQNNAISIVFKRYGVRLSFVPTVLDDGRISLTVSPEVSQLSNQGAVQLTAGNSTISVPALTVRRAQTTVELGSGQSFAIAGLLQDTVTDTASGIPILGDTPVLGALFRSDSFQRNQTELVILVTPLIVRPVSDPAALRLPGANYRPPSDYDRLVRLRQMGTPRLDRPATAMTDVGFIVQ